MADTAEVSEKVLKAVKGLGHGDKLGLNHGDKFDELNSLIKELQCKQPMDERSFCDYLNALRRAVKYVNKQHETLIGVVLNLDWAAYETDTVNLFINFLAELVSAKTYYVKVCIRALIRLFVPKVEVSDDELDILKRKLDYVHTALQAIVHIAPLSSKYIGETVVKCFPYTGKSLFVLETYIVHILQVTVYAPETRFEILRLVVDKLISIDVHVARHELEQESMKRVDDDVPFPLHENMNESSSDVNVSKLDQLMTILFAYIDSSAVDGNTLDLGSAEALVKELLLIYESVVLQTQSSHVQFLLFYVAGFHKRFAESFIETNWKILEDPNNASVLRQASCSYLSSFLARAKFIETGVITNQMKRLSDWILRYMDLQDENTIQADINRHGPYYSACQALFYVFLYHYKSLLETTDGMAFLKSINFVRIVTSRLNPLKYCLSSVVSMFARVTRMYQIVFCYSIIERNNRHDLEMMKFRDDLSSVTDGPDRVFFPFDPYLLPKSAKWIAPSYIHWNLSLDVDDESEDDASVDEGDVSEDEELEEFKHVSISASSFDMMCISPGFQFQNTNVI